MLEYHEKQCSRCDGIGIVRFLLFFSRTCPYCYGTGTVRIPQFRFQPALKKSNSVSAPADKSKLMFVSELTPQTRSILKKNPQLLSALSRENQTSLLRKYRGDFRSGRSIVSDGAAQKREELLRYGGAFRQRQQQFQRFVQQQQQHQQQFQKFVNQSIQQHQNFSNWSQQQHQNWTNQQFHNFTSQFHNFGV